MSKGANRSGPFDAARGPVLPPVEDGSPWRHYLRLVSFWIAVAAVVLAPLPFGSVDDGWEALLCAAMSISLATCDLGRVQRHQVVNALLVLLWLAALLAVLAVQHWPDPPFGRFDPIWHRTAVLLGSPVTPRLAATASIQWSALGSPLLFSLVLVRFILVSHRSRLYLQAWHAFAYGGAIYAVYALGAYLTDPTQVLGRAKVAYVHDLTGTFINRNTAATYFGCLTVLWLTILLSRLGRLPHARITTAQTIRVAVAALILVMCAASTVLTGSRAGVALTAIAAVSVLMIIELTRPGRTRRMRVLTCLAACLAVPITLQVFGERVAERISANGLFDADRMLAYRSTLAIIRKFPLTGIGLGNFAMVFPAFRDPALGAWGIWDRAHNTLLELTAELGVPLAGLTILLGGAIAVQLSLGLGLGVDRRPRELGLAACAIAFIGAAHSMVDFSLQIPGFAAFWAAVVGCGLSAVRATWKPYDHTSQFPLV